MMPQHRTYVEVFGGAGWVLFRKEPSEVEVWNDLNSDLVNLFRVVRTRLDVFKRRQYFLLSSREEYYSFMQAVKKGKFESDVDRAIAFYYLIKNSFGSGIFTGWAFSPSRPPRYCPGLDKLKEARERLRSVYIENRSFDDIIPKWDRKGTLFYCDPPYYMLLDLKGRGYYQCVFRPEEHERLRDILAGIAGRFILSYDDHAEIRRLYRKFHVRKTAPVNYSMNKRQNTPARNVGELLITNF